VELPALESIRNAEDLLQFYSHEFLVSVFGEKNVIKDLYYFSEKEVTKCSVLFPHTNRQAVFIWGDEINLSGPIYLVIGGNLNTASNANYDKVVEENVWRSKDGIYSGMSLNDLIKLNNSDLNFYGKDSKFPFMVVPDNRGVLNFKKNRVVLGCLNPNGSGLLNNEQVSGNEALFDNRAMYVFMIMFPTSPGKDELFLSTK
jgi:hypothetical protein